MSDLQNDQSGEPRPSGLAHESEDADASPGLTRNKADALSPGEILREGRLAHDYSVDDLCAQTKLSAQTVHALEDNDFQSLSQPVFAGGYYRQCAKVLDLDVDRLMAAYAAIAGTAPKPRIDRSAPGGGAIPRDVTSRAGSRLRGLLVLLIIAAAVIAAIVFVLPTDRGTGVISADSGYDNAQPDSSNTTIYEFNSSNDDSGEGEADHNDKLAEPDPIEASDAGQENVATTSDVNDGDAGQAPTGRQPGGRNVNRTLALNPPDQPDGEDADADDSSQSASSVPPNRLVLTFKKRSWAEVVGADGQRMAAGVFESGDTKEFNGKPPYQVTLGFGPGVKVTIGGQSVNVSDHMRQSVAHLSVDAPDTDDALSGD